MKRRVDFQSKEFIKSALEYAIKHRNWLMNYNRKIRSLLIPGIQKQIERLQKELEETEQ